MVFHNLKESYTAEEKLLYRLTEHFELIVYLDQVIKCKFY